MTSSTADRLVGVSDTDRAILTEGLRAPSAHNAQPWRLHNAGERRWELHYDSQDYLPFDPDDRDAYLCMGALIETLSLAATRHAVTAVVADVFTRSGSDLHIADIALVDGTTASVAERAVAVAAADRHTNRSTYGRGTLDPALAATICGLGGALVDPAAIAATVEQASRLSWADRRFVADLGRYCTADATASIGMHPKQLMIKPHEWLLLRGAFRLGRLPGALGALFAGRDVRLLRSAPAVVVLGADSLDPRDLVAAGRRLVRVWVAVCAAGWAYHPISISVDRPETAPDVARLSGIAVPAAVFRVGLPRRQAIRSNRATLVDVVR
jgi:hypothetical protein